jgi:flagellin
MRINNNIMAINSHRQYGINGANIGRNVERLSSGFRVNRAADDAAGLAISEKMRTQIRGLNQASRNSQDGISLVQTAEGAMQTAHGIMQRMRELAVQSANGTNEDFDRDALQLEFKNLISELSDIEDTVKFNNMTVFGGDPDDGLTFTLQSGANQADTTAFNIGRLNTIDGATTMISGTDGENARNAISTLDTAINSLSMARANLGAIQNRLEFKIQNLDNTAENLQAAESRIRDVDMAQQMTRFTRDNILFQASTAMLAQANALPQSVLQLVG